MAVPVDGLGVPEARPRPGVALPAVARQSDGGGARLGEHLLRQGLLSEADLEGALAQHRAVGVPLGSVLLARGLVTRQALYQALGALWGVAVSSVDEVDAVLAGAFSAGEGWVRVRGRRNTDGSWDEVLVAVAGRPDERVVDRVRAVTGAHRVEQVVTTDWDVRQAVRQACRDQRTDGAVEGLANARPDASARRVVTARQLAVLGTGVVALVVCLIRWTRPTAVTACVAINVAFMVSVGFKILVSLVGSMRENEQVVTDEDVAAIDDSTLPLYTVLVPAYREANVVASLMSNLDALDYPKEKLEILLLLESDDPGTLEAAKAASPPDVVRFIVVPEGGPKTKPKACNVGLMFARGEYLVIYDAEDRPEPDQLKKAVVAFTNGGGDLACVQAALNYYNPEDNLLTRMFTLEYSYWFDYMLPGLDALGLPIPLGGTSNHFRTEMLRELGGWDPYNVTEDADLGIRASALRSRVAVINSTTYEEANRAYGNWIRQRSRWIKGYLQTVLVHTRHPWRLLRAVGVRQSLGFALLIGGTPLSFLAGPPLWVVLAATLVRPSLLQGLMPRWLEVSNMVTLFAGNGAIAYLNMLAVFKRRRYRLIWFALFNPLYWVMHSIASVKALWQLVSGRAFFWEKTVHGLSEESAVSLSPGATTTPSVVT